MQQWRGLKPCADEAVAELKRHDTHQKKVARLREQWKAKQEERERQQAQQQAQRGWGQQAQQEAQAARPALRPLVDEDSDDEVVIAKEQGLEEALQVGGCVPPFDRLLLSFGLSGRPNPSGVLGMGTVVCGCLLRLPCPAFAAQGLVSHACFWLNQSTAHAGMCALWP